MIDFYMGLGLVGFCGFFLCFEQIKGFWYGN